MDKIYYEYFTCVNDITSNFMIPEEELDGCEIIYAAYDCPPYEGYAQVIFVKDGKLYEVNGSHCSCNGLEDQWRPEETSLAALMFRPNVALEAKANLKKRFSNLIAFL